MPTSPTAQGRLDGAARETGGGTGSLGRGATAQPIGTVSLSKPGRSWSGKVALVHHWLVNMRGGEKVLQALCELLPQADIYTLVCDPGRISPGIRQHRIFTSFIQRLPLSRRRFRGYLPLFPLAVEQFDLSSYDLVISSDASLVKGVLTPADTPHICYCHSPPRYVWDMYHLYHRQGTGSALYRWMMVPVMHYLRLSDQLAAQRVDHFVANSQAVAARIGKHYRRRADVIYPPVETAYFSAVPREPEDFYLFMGQLVAYKQARLAVEALSAMGRKLVVVGDGPQRRELVRSAPAGVHFAGAVSNEELRTYYARCRALVFPGEEDFGIVPVEAQAAGAPVIAYGRGGALESVVDEVTGVYFGEQSVESLQDAVRRFESREGRFAPEKCRENARRFDLSVFLTRMATLIDSLADRRSPRATAL